MEEALKHRTIVLGLDCRIQANTRWIWQSSESELYDF
jgi:hypothetical protein